jgi:hypothetical protein
MVYVALLLGCLRRALRPNSARRPFSSRPGYQPTRARRPPLRVRMGGQNFAVPRPANQGPCESWPKGWVLARPAATTINDVLATDGVP